MVRSATRFHRGGRKARSHLGVVRSQMNEAAIAADAEASG